MGSRMAGIRADRAVQNRVHRAITRVNPTQMPRLKGRALRKPSRPALDMDMMLLGPGVAAVITA